MRNSQESSCARDSFVIKLQDKTQYQHQTVGTFAFFHCANKLQVFLRHLPKVFLLILRSCGGFFFKYQRFYLLFELYHRKEKLCYFVTNQDIHYPPPPPLAPLNRFYYVEKFVLIACISKRICYFSIFICYVRKTREQYQWTLKVYRLNLVFHWRKYFTGESFNDKAIQFNRSSELWKIPLMYHDSSIDLQLRVASSELHF